MSTLMQLSFGNELAGIFPTCDSIEEEEPRFQPPTPQQPAARNDPRIAAQREESELARIALAEEAWRNQVAIDAVDEASMESFPCSDAPGYYPMHS